MTYLVINKQHAQFVTQGALASVGVYNELDGVVKNSIMAKGAPLDTTCNFYTLDEYR